MPNPFLSPAYSVDTLGNEAAPSVDVESIYKQSARQYNVPYSLLKATATYESGEDDTAKSKYSSAKGRMQLIDDTAKNLGVSNPHDPAQSIPAAAKLYRQLLDHYNGDVTKAVAAYQMGQGKIDSAGGPINEPDARGTSNQDYVNSVLAIQQKIKAQLPKKNPFLNSNGAIISTPTASTEQPKVLPDTMQSQEQGVEYQEKPTGIAERIGKGLGRSLTALPKDVASALQAVGLESAGDVVDYLDEFDKTYLTVADPNFIDDLAQGIGSTATFFIPGLGITKAAKVIGIAAKSAAILAKADTAAKWSMGVLESAQNAGADYRDVIQNGGTEEEAKKAAAITFAANIPLNVLVGGWLFDKIPEGKKLASTLISSGGKEGLQEAAQNVISNIAKGEDIDVGGALYAGGIGATVGGLFGGGKFAATKFGERKAGEANGLQKETPGQEVTQPVQEQEQVPINGALPKIDVESATFTPEESQSIQDKVKFILNLKGQNVSETEARQIVETAKENKGNFSDFAKINVADISTLPTEITDRVAASADKILFNIRNEEAKQEALKKEPQQQTLDLQNNQEAVNNTETGIFSGEESSALSRLSYDDFSKLSKSEQRSAIQRLQQMGEENQATGRPGSRAFARLFDERSENGKKKLTVAIGDINGFKIYNDYLLGLEATDRYNTSLYDIIEKHLGKGNLFNLHGDEYAAFGTDVESLKQKLRAAMDEIASKPFKAKNGLSYKTSMTWKIANASNTAEAGNIDLKDLGKNAIGLDKSAGKTAEKIKGSENVADHEIITRETFQKGKRYEDSIPGTVVSGAGPAGTEGQGAVAGREGAGNLATGGNESASSTNSKSNGGGTPGKISQAEVLAYLRALPLEDQKAFVDGYYDEVSLKVAETDIEFDAATGRDKGSLTPSQSAAPQISPQELRRNAVNLFKDISSRAKNFGGMSKEEYAKSQKALSGGSSDPLHKNFQRALNQVAESWNTSGDKQAIIDKFGDNGGKEYWDAGDVAQIMQDNLGAVPKGYAQGKQVDNSRTFKQNPPKPPATQNDNGEEPVPFQLKQQEEQSKRIEELQNKLEEYRGMAKEIALRFQEYKLNKESEDYKRSKQLYDEAMKEVRASLTELRALGHKQQLVAARVAKPVVPKPEKGSYKDQVQRVESYANDLIPQKSRANYNVVEDESFLPDHIKSEIAARGYAGNVAALIDPTDGKVYILANNIDSKQELERTLAHEHVHAGLRQEFGVKLNEIYEDIYKSITPESKAKIVSAYFAKNNLFDENNEAHRFIVVDEALAEKGETGIKPTLVERLVALVRNYLRKFGLIQSWNNADIIDLVSRARNSAIDSATGGYAFQIVDKNKIIQQSLFGNNESVASLEDKERKRLEKNEIARRQAESKGGEADLANLPLFENQDINGSQLTLFKLKNRSFQNDGVPSEGMGDWLIRMFQDKARRLEVIQKTKGVSLSEENDAFMASKLMFGKVKHGLVKLDNDYVQPILTTLHDGKISVEEFGEYAYAKHAKERNESIRQQKRRALESKDPDLLAMKEIDDSNPSGMSDEMADAIVDRVENGPRAKAFQKAHKSLRDMLDYKIDLIKSANLVDAEKIKLWEKYKNYVPLKGIGETFTKEDQQRLKFLDGKTDLTEEESKELRDLRNLKEYVKQNKQFVATGKGIQPKLINLRARGRHTMARNILENAVVDVQASVIAKEKNEVANKFLKFAKDNPNNDIYEITAGKDLKRTPSYNPTTKEVEWTLAKPDQNVLRVYSPEGINDVEIKDIPLAEGLIDSGPETMGMMAKVSRTFVNFLSAVSTRYSPEFTLSNFSRDIQTALINMGGEQGNKVALDIVKNVPKAINGSWRALREAKNKNEFQKVFEEYRANGGTVEYWQSEDVDMVKKRLNSNLRMISGNIATYPEKAAIAVKNFINDMNGSIEGGVRLATYKALRDSGMSASKAAYMAKGVTVDFNTKGKLSTSIGAWFMFFNAGVQGSARIMKSLAQNPRTRQIALGIIGSSFFASLVNRSVAGDDDDDVNYWDKVPDYVKERNMVFMLPDDVGDWLTDNLLIGEVGAKKYLKIPLPWGYNVFWGAGNSLDKTINGKAADGAVFMLSSFLDAFNPLGSGNPLTWPFPTMTKPLLELWSNKDYAGRSIQKEQKFGVPTARAEQSFKSNTMLAKESAKWLNEITGGREHKSGLIDLSPGWIDYSIDFVFGGIGRTAKALASAGIDVAETGKIPVHEIPFGRKLIGEVNEDNNISEFYSLADQLAGLRKDYENLLSEDRGEARAFAQENKSQLKASEKIGRTNEMNAVKKRLTELRKAKQAYIEEGRDYMAERADKQMVKLAKEFNKKYRKD